MRNSVVLLNRISILLTTIHGRRFFGMAGQPPVEALSPTVEVQDVVVPIEEWDRFVDPIAAEFLRDSLNCVAEATGVPQPLIPLKTTADGNCLAHSISLAIHGHENMSQLLRRQLHRELDQHRSWYLTQLPHVTLEMFEHELEAAGQDERFMDVGTGLHLLAIANVIKRPVLLMASQKYMEHTTMSNCGTYLPLRIPHTDVSSKIPVIVAWQRPDFTGGAGHFVCVTRTSAATAVLPAGWLPGVFPSIDDADSTTLGNYVAIREDSTVLLKAHRSHQLRTVRLTGKEVKRAIVACYEQELCSFLFTCCTDRLFRAITLAFDFGLRFDNQPDLSCEYELAKVNQYDSPQQLQKAAWRLERVGSVISMVKTHTSLATKSCRVAHCMFELMSNGNHNHPGCIPKHFKHFGSIDDQHVGPQATKLSRTQPSTLTIIEISSKEYMQAETEWMRWIQCYPMGPAAAKETVDPTRSACHDPGKESAWNHILWIFEADGTVQIPEKMRKIFNACLCDQERRSGPECTAASTLSTARSAFPAEFWNDRKAKYRSIQTIIHQAQECVRAGLYAEAVGAFDKIIAQDPNSLATNELMPACDAIKIQAERDKAMRAKIHAEAVASGLAVGAPALIRTAEGVVDVCVKCYRGEQVIVVTAQGQQFVLGNTIAEARVQASAAQEKRREDNRIEACRLEKAASVDIQAGDFERACKSLAVACTLVPSDRGLVEKLAFAREEASVQLRENLAAASGLKVGARLWFKLHGSGQPSEATVHDVDARADECYLTNAEPTLHRWLAISEAASLVCEVAECPITRVDFPLELCWQHAGCVWISREGCLHGLETALRGRERPTCANPGCGYILNERDIYAILDSEEPTKKMSLVDKFHEVTQERFYDDKHRCPVVHGADQCKGCILNDPNDADPRMQCDVCHTNSCVLCASYPYHHGCKCEDLDSLTSTWHEWCQRQRDQYLKKVGIEKQKFQMSQQRFQDRQAEITRLQQRHREHLQDEQYKAAHCRRCPHCDKVIQKLEGCSTITCGRDAQDKGGGNRQDGCGRQFDFNLCTDRCTKPCSMPLIHAKPYIVDAGNVRLPPALSEPEKIQGHPHMWGPGDPKTCSQCNSAIEGLMFECVHCVEFRLCLDCEAQQDHDINHVFRIDGGSGCASASRNPPRIGGTISSRPRADAPRPRPRLPLRLEQAHSPGRAPTLLRQTAPSVSHGRRTPPRQIARPATPPPCRPTSRESGRPSVLEKLEDWKWREIASDSESSTEAGYGTSLDDGPSTPLGPCSRPSATPHGSALQSGHFSAVAHWQHSTRQVSMQPPVATRVPRNVPRNLDAAAIARSVSPESSRGVGGGAQPGSWEWQHDDGSWRRFDPSLNTILEAEFLANRAQANLPGRHGWRVTFAEMEQTNTAATGTTRKVRRVIVPPGATFVPSRSIGSQRDSRAELAKRSSLALHGRPNGLARQPQLRPSHRRRHRQTPPVQAGTGMRELTVAAPRQTTGPSRPTRTYGEGIRTVHVESDFELALRLHQLDEQSIRDRAMALELQRDDEA
eukprot:COSAG02_NODE_822_length_16778_cov_4.476168_8_plen_1538_part_00